MEQKPLGIEIKLTQRAIKRFIDAHMQPVTPNLSGAEGMMLRIISRQPDGKASANEIMLSSRVNKSSTSQMLAQLQRKGFLYMEIDPDDRRKKIIHLTPNGYLAVTDMKQVLNDCETSMTAGLSEEEIEHLRFYLGKIRENCLDSDDEALIEEEEENK